MLDMIGPMFVEKRNQLSSPQGQKQLGVRVAWDNRFAPCTRPTVDDMCIHYDGGRVAANESLIAEIGKRGLRQTTKQTRLDRKTIRAIQRGKKVKISTLAKVVMGLREQQERSA